jgi:hypothetical protein
MVSTNTSSEYVNHYKVKVPAHSLLGDMCKVAARLSMAVADADKDRIALRRQRYALLLR